MLTLEAKIKKFFRNSFVLGAGISFFLQGGCRTLSEEERTEIERRATAYSQQQEERRASVQRKVRNNPYPSFPGYDYLKPSAIIEEKINPRQTTSISTKEDPKIIQTVAEDISRVDSQGNVFLIYSPFFDQQCRNTYLKLQSLLLKSLQQKYSSPTPIDISTDAELLSALENAKIMFAAKEEKYKKYMTYSFDDAGVWYTDYIINQNRNSLKTSLHIFNTLWDTRNKVSTNTIYEDDGSINSKTIVTSKFTDKTINQYINTLTEASQNLSTEKEKLLCLKQLKIVVADPAYKGTISAENTQKDIDRFEKQIEGFVNSTYLSFKKLISQDPRKKSAGIDTSGTSFKHYNDAHRKYAILVDEANHKLTIDDTKTMLNFAGYCYKENDVRLAQRITTTILSHFNLKFNKTPGVTYEELKIACLATKRYAQLAEELKEYDKALNGYYNLAQLLTMATENKKMTVDSVVEAVFKIAEDKNAGNEYVQNQRSYPKKSLRSEAYHTVTKIISFEKYNGQMSYTGMVDRIYSDFKSATDLEVMTECYLMLHKLIDKNTSYKGDLTKELLQKEAAKKEGTSINQWYQNIYKPRSTENVDQPHQKK